MDRRKEFYYIQSAQQTPLFSQAFSKNLTGTGVNETDFIYKVNIHKSEGVDTATDLYIQNCRTDFNDLRFTDTEGNNIQFYRHSYGNFEVTPDGITTGKTIILPNGDIITCGGAGNYNKILKSVDGGTNWTTLYTGTGNQELLFIDSRGYIFNIDSYLLKRTVDGGANWTTVFNLTTGSATIQPMAFDEDSSGNLYFGVYQAANGAKIYKSTDGGANWTLVYNSATDQHVHLLQIDPYTDYIYAGIDSSVTTKIIRSIDGGANWTTLRSGAGSDITAIHFADGYRLFGNGESGGQSGYGVIKSIDDSTFTYPLMAGQPIRAIRAHGNNIYAWSAAYGNNRYAQIYRSIDNGETWETIKILDYNSTILTGYSQNQGNFGTTIGTDVILYGNENQEDAKFFSGGSHYQGLFYLKIASFPEDGMNINVITKQSDITLSDVSIFTNTAKTNLIGRWKINEGSGTVIDDSSVTANNGTLTVLSATWNAYGIARVGNLYPAIKRYNKSLKFTGNDATDGYITVPYNAAYALSGNFTLIAWISCEDTASGARYFISNLTATTGFAIGKTGASQVIIFTYSNGTARVTLTSNPYVIIANNQPHMVAIVVDDSNPNKIKFFIDGFLNAEQTLGTKLIASTNNLILGNDVRTNWGNAWKGDLNDVQFYNRALTEIELRSIYEDRPISA